MAALDGKQIRSSQLQTEPHQGNPYSSAKGLPRSLETARERSFNKQKLHLKSFGVIKKDSIATFIISLSFDYGFVAFSDTVHLVPPKMQLILS